MSQSVSLQLIDHNIMEYFRQVLRIGKIECVEGDGATLYVYDIKSAERTALDNNCVIIGTSEELSAFKGVRTLTLPLRAGKVLEGIRAAFLPNLDFPPSITIGPYEFYPVKMLLKGSGGEIWLTEKERDLLYFLYTQQGQTVSRADILQRLWGYVEGVETHTLETHFYRLRQKIEVDPTNPKLLVTSENGYMLSV